MTAKPVPRIIRPQHESGVDWGRDRIVVARKRSKELWWVPGHTAWVSIMEPSGYYATELVTAHFDKERNRWETKHIHDGGRLNAALFRDAADVRKAVNAFLGNEAANLIAANLKRGVTVVLR